MNNEGFRSDILTAAKRQLLRARLREQSVSPVRSIPQQSREGECYPQSYAQERLWLLSQLQPDNPVYHIPTVIRLRGQLDVQVLSTSLREIVRRHQVLRSTFLYDEPGGPVQVIGSPDAFAVRFVDLSVLTTEVREAEAHSVLDAERNRPFDLAREYGFRACVIRMGEDHHLLVSVMHHIVFDGWSGWVFHQELASLYTALMSGDHSPLPELPIQYADYAAWQRTQFETGELESELAYWRKQLAGYPGVLELPSDRPRPVQQTFRGARETLRFPAVAAGALRRLGHSVGATTFMTLLALFKVLLFRLTGQEQIAVGAPAAHRSHGQTEGLIGCFLNTLVLRTDLAEALPFREALRRVVETTIGAYEHGHVPFEMVVEMLKPGRDLSSTPLIQVMFNMLSFGDWGFSLPGVTAEFLENPEPGSKFDMTIYALERDGEILLNWVYNADLFRSERVQEMVRQFQQIADLVLTDPDMPIGDISLVTASSAHLLPDPTEPQSDAWVGSVPDLLRRADAEKSALEDSVECWTYGDLDRWSNRLGNALLTAGLQRGDVVAIYGRRSATLVWAILGTLKSGAVYLILDPAYPVSRLAEYIDQARPRALLWFEADGALPEAVRGAVDPSVFQLALPRLEQASASAALSAQPDCPTGVQVGPDDLAVITFTSGSTGRPKGVLGRHGPLTHFYPWLATTFGLTASDRLSMLSGLSHDPLQRDVFTAIYLGATLYIPDPEHMMTPGWLAHWMRHHAITFVNLTPAMLQILASGLDNEDMVLPTLRHAFIVGDVLTRNDAARIRRRCPAILCVNLYGATETQRALAYFVSRDDDGWEKDVLPLGQGMQDTQLLILNARGRLSGVGESGEIHVRSPHLAQGYLGDVQLTRERFLTNPFTGTPEDRIYRTGDLGRYTPSGMVELLGRADQQVKIRGFRVEPGDIQAALEQHPAVCQAVIVDRANPTGERQLVAYIVPTQHRSSVTEVFRFLRERLPDYMVPSAFVFLEALPLLPSGKVDRLALPAPDAGRPEFDTTFLPTRTPTEDLIATIWSHVLRVGAVGAHDNFFELGGHSLLATQVMNRICNIFQIDLPLAVLFAAPTVAQLAARVEEAGREVRGITEPPVTPAVRTGELPLSFSQQRLWILNQLEPGSPAYNVHWGLRFSGRLNPEVIRNCLTEIVRRHEILRTRFPFSETLQQPVQVVEPAEPVSLHVIDVSMHVDPEAEARRLADEQLHRPFDLAHGRLLRATLVRLSDHEHALLLTLHHMICDGWSVGVMNRELMVLYVAMATGQTPPLPALPIQYADFSDWQRRWLQGPVLDQQMQYWRERLAGLQDLALPTDFPRPARRTGRGHRVRFQLPAELADGLKKLSRSESATLFMTLLAAFQALLHRYSGQTDISVGSPIANRTREAMEPLIGVFVNTLLLRADLSGNPTFRSLMRRVREMTLGAYQHQDLPFEMLVEALQPDRDLSRTPLFQVMFVLQNAPTPAVTLDGLVMNGVAVDSGSAKFDLTVGMFEDSGGLGGYIEYATDLFSGETIERLVGHWRTLLGAAVADPDCTVGDLPLLTEGEQDQLAAWNRTERPYPPARCLHELFAEQAERTPDAPALVYEGSCLTYRELNRSANRIGHYLQKLGVGPEVTVGICMERSPEMVIGILGVLKTGGAYVPLDPEYPHERLAYMLEDSRVSVVLTQERMRGIVSDKWTRVVALDTEWELINRESSDNPQNAATPDNLAYVIYTSGSTGRPKGAMIEHRSIYNRLVWMQEAYGLSSADRVLQKTPFSFDVSVWEFFWTLLYGAQLVVARPGGHRDGAYLAGLIRDAGVTTVHFVPSMLQAFLEEEAAAECHTLRRVICSGEELSRELRDCFFTRIKNPWVSLHNLYGPTEVAVDVTFVECRPEDRGRRVPIGRPIANTCIYTLDANLHQTPVGIPGELCIGGVNVGRGYCRRPDLTAENFIPDPFGNRPGSRLYQTGDLARWLPDGTLEYLGRLDNQVKVRGHRVELGEIESVLRQHPALLDAVVTARDGSGGEKRLVAYLVPAEVNQPAVEELRRHLQASLPEFMVPGAFVWLDAIPLSHNGKVDRRALPAPGLERPDLGTPYVAPRSALEGQIAEIWADVLALGRVGVLDNFFSLGGDSLRAVRVAARLRALGYDIALEHLFQHQTVSELCRNLTVAQSSTVSAQPFDLVSEADLQLLEAMHNDDAPGDEGGTKP